MCTENLTNRFFFLVLSWTIFAGLQNGFSQDQGSSADQEKKLLAVLRADGAESEKAIACKQLSIHGSSQSVAELAKLLPHPRLSSWARIALEVIPGAEADNSLRKAVGSLQGNLLVGTINSIGFRRDANAVNLLAERLSDPNEQVASAAAVALGRIGGAAAVKLLQNALQTTSPGTRSAAAEGCVLCAEQLMADGQLSAAVEVYDRVRGADVPQQRIVEATRGAILSRGEKGDALLLEILHSPNRKLFQLGLGTIREFPGNQLDKTLALNLDQFKADRVALVITAMADREDTVDIAAIRTVAQSGSTPVRVAAARALGNVGDASCLPVLLKLAAQSDVVLSEAARAALVRISGEDVNDRIAQLLSKSAEDSRLVLIELVGERRINALGDLFKAMKSERQVIRVAALKSLGQTISLNQLPVLVTELISPRNDADRVVVEKALRVASVRMPDREACAKMLTQAMSRVPKLTRSVILEILADVGGDTSLVTLAAAANDADPQLQDTGSRLLGKWNGVEAAPILLDLAKNGRQTKYQIRALRGYIGLVRKFRMAEPLRVEMCQRALAAARRIDEKKLVLEVLKIHPSVASLQLAIKTMDVKEISNEARATALAIAKKVGGRDADVAALMSKAAFDKVELEIVKGEYGAGGSNRDVTAILRRHAGDIAMIVLPSGNYNGAFGDPAPGSAKRLKIQYRLNGKNGVASFAENEIIIFPVPK